MKTYYLIVFFATGWTVATAQNWMLQNDEILKMINIKDKHPLGEMPSCVRTTYVDLDSEFYSNDDIDKLTIDTIIVQGVDTFRFSKISLTEYVKNDSSLIVTNSSPQDDQKYKHIEKYQFTSDGKLIYYSTDYTDIIVQRIGVDSIVYTHSYRIDTLQSAPKVNLFFAKYRDDGFPISVGTTKGSFFENYTIDYAKDDTLIYGPQIILDENKFGPWSSTKKKDKAQRTLNYMELLRRSVVNKIIFKKPSGGFDFYIVNRTVDSEEFRSSYFFSKENRLYKSKRYKDGIVDNSIRYLYNHKGDLMRTISSKSTKLKSKGILINYVYTYDGIQEGDLIKGEGVTNMLITVSNLTVEN